ncbi:protein kinase [Protofrankia symbiont of Coriaria ruscifolia]|uniref:protein kinase n=1 Tax=Protofrankia symbiont of Coriaria ruscifolia TaxID=1306542 RepID=UPI0013EF9412|nr:protein kinase [Protofrankia symbiont of Coriaria ruscifolia]
MYDSTGSRGGRENPVDSPVPGVVLRARVRDAGAGDVWAGRVVATGAECTLRRVRLPPDAAGREAAMRSARLLVELSHPHLVPVIDVIATSEGIAVVSEPVNGAVNLARLLGVRDRLDPGEVVTVGLPLAQALATAHSAGVVHGRLDLADVLLEPNGRPVLAGTGIAGLGGSSTTPPVDVGDLAGLLLAAMPHATGPDAAAVAVAVAPALVDDPVRRPTAEELAAALARSCNPAPVRLEGRRQREDVLSALPEAQIPGSLVSGAAAVLPLPALPAGRDGAPGQAATDRVRLAPPIGSPPTRLPRMSRTSEPASRRGRRAPAAPGGSGTARAGTAAAGTAGAVTARATPPRTGNARPGSARPGGTRTGGRRSATTHVGTPAVPTGGRASLGSRRRILLVVAAFVVFVGLPAGGLLVTARSAGLSGQQPAPEQAWRDVLVSLTNARSSAFAQADEAGLLDADALDSTAYARDLTLMRQMVAKGGRTSGLRQEIIDLAVRESGSEKTVLRITYRLPPYSYVDTDGTVLAQQPGYDRRQSDVTLVKTDRGWRVASWVDPAG